LLDADKVGSDFLDYFPGQGDVENQLRQKKKKKKAWPEKGEEKDERNKR
jgi:hypothetical protein